MSNNRLKNWQETACTVTNTADNEHIHLFGRIYEKRIQTRRWDLVLQHTFASFVYFLLIAKMQGIQKNQANITLSF